MTDIIHKIRVEATPEKVYSTLTSLPGLAGWWTKWVTFEKGNGEVGSIIRFGFGDDKMGIRFEVTKLDENKRIEWKGLGAAEESEEDEENDQWTFNGTKIVFNLKEETVEYYGNKKMTAINFSHIGYKKADDFYAESNTRWGFFLLSLKDFIEKGKGMPVPDDIYM